MARRWLFAGSLLFFCTVAYVALGIAGSDMLHRLTMHDVESLDVSDMRMPASTDFERIGEDLPEYFDVETRTAVSKAVRTARECELEFANNDDASDKVMMLGDEHRCFPSDLYDADGALVRPLQHEFLRRSECSRIPKIIHQVWKEKVPSDDVVRAYSATWRVLNPLYVHIVWTDEDCRQFLEQHYSWFLPQFDSYPYSIQKFDAIRYFILQHFGGVYADMDMELKHPIDSWIYLANSKFIRNSNSLMACTANNSFATALVRNLTFIERKVRSEEVFKHYYVLRSTGPMAVEHVAKGLPARETCTLPFELIQPCSFCVDDTSAAKCDCVDCLAIHRYAKSWNSYSAIWENQRSCNPSMVAFCLHSLAVVGSVAIVAVLLYLWKRQVSVYKGFASVKHL